MYRISAPLAIASCALVAASHASAQTPTPPSTLPPAEVTAPKPRAVVNQKQRSGRLGRTRSANRPVTPAPIPPAASAVAATSSGGAGSGPPIASAAASEKTVSGADVNARPFSRPAEALEVVPGLIITQHSGDGKANQYFLRGFNLDHGTDLAISVDGITDTLSWYSITTASTRATSAGEPNRLASIACWWRTEPTHDPEGATTAS